MARKSSIALAMVLVITATSFAGDLHPATLRLAEPVEREVHRRAIGNLRIEGNETFSVESIRNALLADDEIQSYLWPEDLNRAEWTGTSWQEYSSVLQQQILAGYLDAGFLEARIEVKTVGETQPATVVVDEGAVFTTGDVKIDGVGKELAEELRQALRRPIRKESMTHAFLQLMGSKQTKELVWPQNKAASTSQKKKLQIVQFVDSYMRAKGFGFADSSVEFIRDNDQHVVNLRIAVIPREQNRISEIQFTGLQKYSEADVRRIINIDVGTPASPELCRNVESALTGSGRFLFAKCETQTPFGPEQPVAMNIRVREYEDVLPEDEFSEIQQAVLRYGQWLSDWQTDGPDFVLEATVDVSKCVAALSGKGDEPAGLVSRQVLSSLRIGQLRLVVSPQKGAMLTLKATDADGHLRLNHTVVHCSDLCGIVSHVGKRSWLQENTGEPWPTIALQMALRGADPELSQRRLSGKYGWKLSSEGEVPIQALINIEATALLCGLTSRTDSFGEPIKRPAPRIEIGKDGREVLKAHGIVFACDIDAETGQLLSASAESEAGDGTITFQRGQLQKDIDKLLDEAASAKNFAESDSGPESAIGFLAAEVNGLCTAENQPLMMLWAALLNDTKVQKAATGLMSQFETHQGFHIPNSETDSEETGSALALLYWLTPSDSAIRDVIRALTGVAKRRSAALLASLSFNAMYSDHYGPVSCAGLAYLYRGLNLSKFAQPIAVFGHRRLMADGLLKELQGYTKADTLTGAIAFACVRHIKKLDGDELEQLVNGLMKLNLTFGQRKTTFGDLPLRIALTAVHSHPSHDPQIVLHDGLLQLCESLAPKLDEFLATQTLPPAESKSLFRRASSTKAKDVVKSLKNSRDSKTVPPVSELDLTPDLIR